MLKPRNNDKIKISTFAVNMKGYLNLGLGFKINDDTKTCREWPDLLVSRPERMVDQRQDKQIRPKPMSVRLAIPEMKNILGKNKDGCRDLRHWISFSFTQPTK